VVKIILFQQKWNFVVGKNVGTEQYDTGPLANRCDGIVGYLGGILRAPSGRMTSPFRKRLVVTTRTPALASSLAAGIRIVPQPCA
jgi:hypothetical protein